MKKSVKALTFAAAVMATGMVISGCGDSNEVVVYGPPPSDATQTAVTQSTAEETTDSGKPEETSATDATFPSGFDPSTEFEVDVYGPPPED